MDASLADFAARTPRSAPLSLAASLALPSPQQQHAVHLGAPLSHAHLAHAALSVAQSPSGARRLDVLRREQALLSSMKGSIPNAWAIIDAEISRLQGLYLEPRSGKSAGARKRIKLRVPAEKYPDYNFVGRLLGPRGATLKKLERDTGCKIMIRGRGSIRKDKEAEVRGKPGWEHVFNETLHVVIEAADAEDSDAGRVLARAREMVELLLVPVPEERDTLKRQQLRDLAILNGTFRAADPYSARAPPRDFALSSNLDQSPTDLLSRRRAHSAQPSPPPTSHHIQNNINFASGALASSPSLARHGGPVAVAAAAAAAAAAGMDADASYSRAPLSHSHPKLPSRSDSYLPDIGALRIPSLEIESMSEAFLVSPLVGQHGLPGPSPTIVDPDMYPFPSTPSVPTAAAAFGSPIWAGAPASSPSASTNASAPLTLSSSPMPSPSPPTSHSRVSQPMQSPPPPPPALLLDDRAQQRAVDAAMARERAVAQEGEESSSSGRAFGAAAFANYFPKLTGVPTGARANGDTGQSKFAHAK